MMEVVKDEKCLFCQIVMGKSPSKKVWENEDFLAIENKYPQAPVHVLVMPKEHIEKEEVRKIEDEQNILFWGKMMDAVFQVVKHLGLNKTGYKLVNNGAGYNHFKHEHIHVLGGSKEEPAGKT